MRCGPALIDGFVCGSAADRAVRRESGPHPANPVRHGRCRTARPVSDLARGSPRSTGFSTCVCPLRRLGAAHALSPDVRLGSPGLDSLHVRNAPHQLDALWALARKGAVVNGVGPAKAPGRCGYLAYLPPPGTDSVGPQVSGRSRGVEPDAGNVPATAVRSWVERASTSSAHAGSSARFISSRGSASWS